MGPTVQMRQRASVQTWQTPCVQGRMQQVWQLVHFQSRKDLQLRLRMHTSSCLKHGYLVSMLHVKNIQTHQTQESPVHVHRN